VFHSIFVPFPKTIPEIIPTLLKPIQFPGKLIMGTVFPHIKVSINHHPHDLPNAEKILVLMD
jgi:hypothetical protein